jgi:hypothetical protein
MLSSSPVLAAVPEWLLQSLPGIAILVALIGFFLFRGSPARRQQKAAEAAKVRARRQAEGALELAQAELRALERLAAPAGLAPPELERAQALERGAVEALAQRDDAAGLERAREAAGEIERLCRETRGALATAHPKVAALDYLERAKEHAKGILDPEARAGVRLQIARANLFAGDLQGGQAAVEAIEDPTERDVARRELASTLASLEQASAARAMAEGIEDAWCRADAWRTIAESDASRGDLANARTAAERIEEPSLKASAQKAIACAQARAGDAQGAELTLGAISDAQIRGLAAEEVAAAILASSDLAVAAERAAALDDSDTWANLAEACASRGDVERASAALEHLGDGPRRDAAAGAVAIARGGGPGWRTALDLAGTIQDGWVRATVLLQLSRIRKDEQDAAGRRELLELFLVSAGDTLTPSNAYAVLPLVAQVHAALGNFEQSRAALGQIDDPVHRAETLRDLVAREASEQDFAAVERSLEQARNPLEESYVLLGAASGCLK